MKELKIYEVSDVLVNLKKGNYEKYYIKPNDSYFLLYCFKKEENGFSMEQGKIEKISVYRNFEENIEEYIRKFGKDSVYNSFEGMEPLELTKKILQTVSEMNFLSSQPISNIQEFIFNLINKENLILEKVIFEDTDLKEEDRIPKKGIYMCPSLVEAEKLLTKILIDPRSNSYSNVEINPYQNGREQGISLKYLNKHDQELSSITFTTSSGSDNLVVYDGPFTDFSISEEAFYNSTSFHWRHFNKAKEYIFSLLDEKAFKSYKRTSFTINQSFETTKKIMNKLLKDKRSEEFSAMIECLQSKEFIGHGIMVFNMKSAYKKDTIYLAEKEDKILLFLSNYTFRGLEDNSLEKTFDINDTDKIIDYIFEFLKENTKIVAKTI